MRHVMLLEHPVERHHLLVELLIELIDPQLQLQLLVLPLTLQLLRTLNDLPLEILSSQRVVLALKRHRVDQLLYFILSEAGPQLFQTDTQLLRVKFASWQLGAFVSPLSEKSLVSGILL